MWGFETQAEGGSLRWLADYQRVLVNAFVDIETTGFPLDTWAHRKFIQKASKIHERYEAKLRRSLDLVSFCATHDREVEGFNFRSTPDMAAFLFSDEGLGLEPVQLTKTGKPSTNEKSLETFAKGGVAFADDLLVLRKFGKLLSAFGEPLLRFYSPETGAVHPNYFLAKVVDTAGKYGGTLTGRLSCKAPNIQQLPKRDKDKKGLGLAGIEARRSFVPLKDHILVEVDESQIEIRVAAMYAEDDQMAEFFRLGGDFHTRVAAMIHKVEYELFNIVLIDDGHHLHEDYTAKRYKAKRTTFGLLYGMGLLKLMLDLGMTEEEGEAFIEAYFAMFPGLVKWREGMIEWAREHGHVTSLFGRRRQIKVEGFDTRDGREERIGINTPVQSAAADITLYALARIWERLMRDGWESRLLGTIHDSIVLSVPPAELNKVLPWVVEYMMRPPGLEWLLDETPVPLSVGVDLGLNFRDMNEVSLEVVQAGEVDPEMATVA